MYYFLVFNYIIFKPNCKDIIGRSAIDFALINNDIKAV